MSQVELTQEMYVKLDSFQGYGRLDAPLWIVGQEERTRTIGADDIAHDLEQRLRFKDVMDLKEAHKLLDSTLSLSETKTPTWRWASKFARAFLYNARDWDDNNQAKVYIDTQLGRMNGQTFLTDLFAVPTPPKGMWPYKGQWEDRNIYLKSIRHLRQQRLISLIRLHQPKIVMAYGLENRMALQSSINPETLNEFGRILLGNIDSSLVALTPFWGGQFGSGISKVEAAELIAAIRSRYLLKH
jgi:hypothetical protein